MAHRQKTARMRNQLKPVQVSEETEWQDLLKQAGDAGINPVGKSRAEIEKLLKEGSENA